MLSPAKFYLQPAKAVYKLSVPVSESQKSSHHPKHHSLSVHPLHSPHTMSDKAFTFISVLLVSTLCVSALPATLYFAADNEAKAYLNGELIGTVKDPSFTGIVENLNLQPGNVLAIVAKDTGGNYGVIADVDLGAAGHCVTQVNKGHWRALDAPRTTGSTRILPPYFTSADACAALAEPRNANTGTIGSGLPVRQWRKLCLGGVCG